MPWIDNEKYHFGRTPFRSLSTPLPANSCGKLVDVHYLLDDSIHSLAYGHYKIAVPPLVGAPLRREPRPPSPGRGGRREGFVMASNMLRAVRMTL